MSSVLYMVGCGGRTARHAANFDAGRGARHCKDVARDSRAEHHLRRKRGAHRVDGAVNAVVARYASGAWQTASML
jgi:hypothetical protein